MLVYWAHRPWVKDRIRSNLHRLRLMSETAESPPSFEAALAELEALVSRMESGDLPLQESLAAYKRGAELLAHCQSALKDAQQQVQVLEKGVLQPFSADDADDA
jgi:exodeoxyribonuclease VII, small subunit